MGKCSVTDLREVSENHDISPLHFHIKIGMITSITFDGRE